MCIRSQVAVSIRVVEYNNERSVTTATSVPAINRKSSIEIEKCETRRVKEKALFNAIISFTVTHKSGKKAEIKAKEKQSIRSIHRTNGENKKRERENEKEKQNEREYGDGQKKSKQDK